MANPRVAPKNISQTPDQNGAYTVTVTAMGSGDVDVVLSEREAAGLVKIVQQGILERGFQRTVHPSYPQFTIKDVSIAHGEHSTGLLLTTAEVGAIVVALPPDLLGKLSHEIARAIDAQSARTRPS